MEVLQKSVAQMHIIAQLGEEGASRRSGIPTSTPCLALREKSFLRLKNTGLNSRAVSRRAQIRSRVCFASLSETTQASNTVSSITTPPPPLPTPNSYPGSPLFWFGVGVATSVFVQWLARTLKAKVQQMAMQQMMEMMKQGMSPSSPSSPFSPSSTPPNFSDLLKNAGSPSSPFPPPFSPYAAAPPSPSKSAVFDVTAQVSEKKETSAAPPPPSTSSPLPASPSSTPTPSTATSAASSAPPASPQVPREEKRDEEPKRRAKKASYFTDTEVVDESFSGGFSWNNPSPSQNGNSAANPASGLTVEALEKMMEDPTVQQMIFPYLPEEMRDPTTFKWMMQNPVYKKQLQDMLDGMGNGQMDTRVVDMMKNFDLNSKEVQDQFAMLGMSPDQVVSKIMSNPDIASAFQNPRIQAAILDCSTNPLNITKYQNDEEVMRVFNKIQELFPVQM